MIREYLDQEALAAKIFPLFQGLTYNRGKKWNKNFAELHIPDDSYKGVLYLMGCLGAWEKMWLTCPIGSETVSIEVTISPGGDNCCFEINLTTGNLGVFITRNGERHDPIPQAHLATKLPGEFMMLLVASLEKGLLRRAI